MLTFFESTDRIYAVESMTTLSKTEVAALEQWYLRPARCVDNDLQSGPFVGPRTAVTTPWSTNAVAAIDQPNITRVESYRPWAKGVTYDPMLQEVLNSLRPEMFQTTPPLQMVQSIEDIAAFNATMGLSLGEQGIAYLHTIASKYQRPLTDAEIFAYGQVNSNHGRHTLFNGKFIIDGREQPRTLFEMIKETYRRNPGTVKSAYVDNAAAFGSTELNIINVTPDGYVQRKAVRVHSTVKAETHNHPTGVSPFDGAGTGGGGRMRDGVSVGTGSLLLFGGAAYFVPDLKSDRYLYQPPIFTLIEASNGASDYGNKIGEPLINGTTRCFSMNINGVEYSYDKPIMLSSGVGLVLADNLEKKPAESGMAIVLLGGANYRIGVGGGSASSADLGSNERAIDFNSVQRSDPEMQRRVFKVIEYFAKADRNPIISIHDHGAGGHGNCFAELAEAAGGGEIWLDALPVGDPSLNYMEVISNESQEREGLIIEESDWDELKAVADREKCPAYLVGRITGDGRFTFVNRETGEKPFDMALEDLFGNTPKMVIEDIKVRQEFAPLEVPKDKFDEYLVKVLRHPDVGSKEYLTSKVDRSVGGQVVQQQCVGPLQVPVSDYGLVKKSLEISRCLEIDHGLAEALGDAPFPMLIDVENGARLAVAESLTNLLFSGAKLEDVALSANWMWPCHNPGEDTRLYRADEAVSQMAIELGIPIPTGKDSTSMTQVYPDGTKVLSPGTVVITAAGNVGDVSRAVTSQLSLDVEDTALVAVGFTDGMHELGGSTLAYVLGQTGDSVPKVNIPKLKHCYEALARMIEWGDILAGHDISSGGLITALLEMVFATGNTVEIKSNRAINCRDAFSEAAGVVLQMKKSALCLLDHYDVPYSVIGDHIVRSEVARIQFADREIDASKMFEHWSTPSLRLDSEQTSETCLRSKVEMLGQQPLRYEFPAWSSYDVLSFDLCDEVVAAVIRDEGTNGEAEMQAALLEAGFIVQDITMTDLMSGRRNLDDVQVIVFAGGFSNSDVLGAATGWAGKFMHNELAKSTLEHFYARPDTLSLGICNGCQLMGLLGLIDGQEFEMLANQSGRFESNFVNVTIGWTNSAWLEGLYDCRLGVWIAHGEGQFPEQNYGQVALRYSYEEYPGNPNGSFEAIAGIASQDGRHLAMMPHPERGVQKTQWADYPTDHKYESKAPWAKMFRNAYHWCVLHLS
jgi:phosphoribosylformylglycinamidine synthase